jgi:hypothetical protein
MRRQHEPEHVAFSQKTHRPSDSTAVTAPFALTAFGLPSAEPLLLRRRSTRLPWIPDLVTAFRNERAFFSRTPVFHPAGPTRPEP